MTVTVVVGAGLGFLVTLTLAVVVAVAVTVTVLPAIGTALELEPAPKIAPDNEDADNACPNHDGLFGCRPVTLSRLRWLARHLGCS